MSRLMEDFNEVDKNAVLRAAHQFEPLISMTRFGLSTDEQEAVMSGEVSRLADAVGVEMREGAKLQVLHVPQVIYRDELH